MKAYLASLLVLGLMACMNQEATTAQNSKGEPQPGRFSFGTLSSAKQVADNIPIQDSSPVYDFDLGNASGSIQRFFILKNTGDIDIRNVEMKTDNPQFYFSPSTLRVLQSSKNAAVLQVITLDVIHGKRLDGSGPDSLLPMGINQTVAHITGLTTNAAGDSLIIREDAHFQVFANVLDFKVYKADSSELDAQHYELVSGLMEDFTTDPIRAWDRGQDTIKVVNTGNVPFTLRAWRMNQDDSPVLLDSVEVQSGGTLRLSADYLEIDGKGVITNPFKPYLQPASNGKIYMAFINKTLD